MELRANYFGIGIFVLVFAAGLLLFTLWVARVELIETRPAYRVIFTGSVTGLKEGSPVRYRGIPVGKVSEIRIDPDNVEQVLVTIHIDEETPIKTDTVASLEIKGMTGNSFIQLDGGTHAAPRLVASGPQPPEIPAKPSLLGALFDRAPELLDTVSTLGDRMTAILSAENERLITDALRNLHTMSVDLATAAKGAEQTMAAMRASAQNMEGLMADMQHQTVVVAKGLDETLGRVRVTLSALDENSKVGLKDLTETSSEVRKLAQSLKTLSDEVGGVMQDSRLPLRDFASVGLYELSRLIIEARELAASLARVSREVERNPVNFLLSGTQTQTQTDRRTQP